jgi:hypothetical protein
MRGLQTLCYTNPGPGGQRQVVVEGDPRQAVKVYQAGDFISEQRARELGIYDWLLGEPPSGPQAEARGADDPEAQARKAVEASAKVRAAALERSPLSMPSVEERAFVENAVSQPVQLSAAERGEAGSLGAEITGPTMPEIAQAGSVPEATDKAAAEMTGGEKPPEEKPVPQAPAPEHGAARTPPPPPPPPSDDPSSRRRP